jgi:hypothetical protein
MDFGRRFLDCESALNGRHQPRKRAQVPIKKLTTDTTRVQRWLRA